MSRHAHSDTSGHVRTDMFTTGPIKSRTHRLVKTSLTNSIAQQVAILYLIIHTKIINSLR